MAVESQQARLDLAAIPPTVQVDLCVMAITQAAAAMASPEGREAIEKGKQEYLRHLAERERSDAGQEKNTRAEGG